MIKKLLGLMNKFINWLTERPAEVYVNPLAIEYSMEELHTQALFEDKQRSLKKKLDEKNKSMLQGYMPPKPSVGNRVDIHMERAGIAGKEKMERYGSPVRPAKEQNSQKKTAKN